MDDQTLSLWALGCPPGALASDESVQTAFPVKGTMSVDERKRFAKLLIAVAPEAEMELLSLAGGETTRLAQALVMELVVHTYYTQLVTGRRMYDLMSDLPPGPVADLARSLLTEVRVYEELMALQYGVGLKDCNDMLVSWSLDIEAPRTYALRPYEAPIPPTNGRWLLPEFGVAIEMETLVGIVLPVVETVIKEVATFHSLRVGGAPYTPVLCGEIDETPDGRAFVFFGPTRYMRKVSRADAPELARSCVVLDPAGFRPYRGTGQGEMLCITAAAIDVPPMQPMVLGPQSETFPPLHAPDHVANRAVYSWQRFNELTCHVRQLERNVRTLTQQLMSSLANEVDLE